MSYLEFCMKIEQKEKILDRIHEWIRSADQKVSIFLAFQGVTVTFVFPNLEIFKKILSIQNYTFQIFVSIFFMIGFVLVVLGIFKSLFAIIPRVKKKTNKSLMYFGAIAEMGLSEYRKYINGADEHKYHDEIVDQIYFSSGIAQKKHILFSDAVISYITGFIFLFFCFVLVKIYGN